MASDILNPSNQELEHQVKSPIIETLGVSKLYNVGGKMITPVSDVTLQIGYGDFVVIFGPSGAGKSTLMSMLMGLEKPDVGEVFIKGDSLFGFTEEQRTIIRRKKISYLPQTQYWIEAMNLIDNVAVPLYLQGYGRSKARKKAVELLVEVGLGDELKQRPEDLSSGQQQKAALARALIKQPWILFADEPTAHLDTKSVEEVTSILTETAKKYGITIIMVTHDLSFLKWAEKWLFMQDGRLWNIDDKHNPFNNIKEAIDYVGMIEANKKDNS
jgi:putative ABC transport system ATP-binding protein